MKIETRLSDVLSEFARTVVTDFPIQAILDHLVGRIVEVLPISAAGVTLISPGVSPRYVAASNASARSGASTSKAPMGLKGRWVLPWRYKCSRRSALGSTAAGNLLGKAAVVVKLARLCTKRNPTLAVRRSVAAAMAMGVFTQAFDHFGVVASDDLCITSRRRPDNILGVN